MAETRHVIEHVQIIADFELSRDEAHAYYIYARSKYAGITALYLHLMVNSYYAKCTHDSSTIWRLGHDLLRN